ncbi:MAG: 16S rRNA (adenine(1518)-N(6)/adenine(1519)-N(6))-dimethyltransferase RsmA [Deltaproteobacteria bacterium]|nr:16S rRNA (adenine(1518)-N(6)/adenine(1519)-N(6))-dimethyltransferase RsmA [Deltaproteobacteria bacterium]
MPSPAERAVFHQRRELAARDIRLKASLGQNILDDPNLCAKIVRAADIVPGETVLEIGPGAGALTRALLDAGARVLAVETDGRLIPLLEERFAGEDHLVVRHADFMKFDLAEARPSTPDGRVKVVSNLPYHLSSPILFRLIDHRALISTATVMLQKEMAARVASGPGTKDYGIVSVRVQAVAEARALFTLPPQVFFPSRVSIPRSSSSIFGARACRRNWTSATCRGAFARHSPKGEKPCKTR